MLRIERTTATSAPKIDISGIITHIYPTIGSFYLVIKRWDFVYLFIYYWTMNKAGINPPVQSHTSNEASALPPSHHGWTKKENLEKYIFLKKCWHQLTFIFVKISDTQIYSELSRCRTVSTSLVLGIP